MVTMARGGVPKPPEERADVPLNIRVRQDQIDAYQKMAEYEGMSRSGWIKMILDRAAKIPPKKKK